MFFFLDKLVDGSAASGAYTFGSVTTDFSVSVDDVVGDADLFLAF